MIFVVGFTWLNRKGSFDRKEEAVEIAILKQEFLRLERSIKIGNLGRENLGSSVFTKEMLEDIEKRTVEAVTEDVVQSVRQKIEASVLSEYKREATTERATAFLHDQAKSVRYGLDQLKDQLRKRANISLMMGVTSASFGLIMLLPALYIDNNAPQNQDNWLPLVCYYVPRAGIILLVEFVAIFFLKQYRVSLGDIKYVHNEITNLEMKLLAAGQAVILDNKELMAQCVANLLSTERNFILRSGESTVELEKAKAEASLARHLVRTTSGTITSLFSRENKDRAD